MFSSRYFLYSLCFQLPVQQPPQKISLSISNHVPIIYISNLNYSHTFDKKMKLMKTLQDLVHWALDLRDRDQGLILTWNLAMGWFFNLLTILISLITFTFTIGSLALPWVEPFGHSNLFYHFHNLESINAMYHFSYQYPSCPTCYL